MLTADKTDKFRSCAGEQGFTLVEILVVIAMISILASIVFPVVARTRERGRMTTCLSNERQLGIAVEEYSTDNDSTYPNGIQQTSTGRPWQGVGWASQCMPYADESIVFNCPSDTVRSDPPHSTEVSYGYNINLIEHGHGYEDPLSGLTESDLGFPANTVLLFEVSNVLANLNSPREGAFSGPQGPNFSASGNGLDNRLYAQKDASTSTANKYATGYLGGRVPSDLLNSQFESQAGRHDDGSTFLFCDGHAKWLNGNCVSSGVPLTASYCNQDNVPSVNGCAIAPGVLSAAGTDHGPTFSPY